MGLGLAFRCFFKALTDSTFAERVTPVLMPPAIEEKKPSGESLRLLAILQRDGRLLDFLTEEIDSYGDDQIGAAVRDIHRDCRKALTRYVELGPVIDKPEESKVEVPVGFDPSSIRLTGKVAGSPPFHGTLAHRGWRATRVDLPPAVTGSDPLLIAPAEVEIP
ncbi:MAG: DUF2760 domain-containing protein [Planctomycetota bacterium]